MICNPKTYHQIKRVVGQMNGVVNMIDEHRDCEAVVTQLMAIRSSIDKVIAQITTQNLISTIEESYNIQLDNIDKEINLLIKSK